MEATIKRTKLYPTAGKNYRAAWKWLYKAEFSDVNVGTISGFDRLKTIVEACKRKGATTVSYSWEQPELVEEQVQGKGYTIPKEGQGNG